MLLRQHVWFLGLCTSLAARAWLSAADTLSWRLRVWPCVWRLWDWPCAPVPGV
jgi:hypothetical protein